MEQVQGFERFLAGFIGRHPEWFGDSEAVKARERFEEAMARVPAVEPVEGDEMDGIEPVQEEAAADAGTGDWAEEIRDEEAEAEEAAALFSE